LAPLLPTVDSLPCKHEALSSNPSTVKGKKKNETRNKSVIEMRAEKKFWWLQQ
jgi:hypothetical protein